MKPSSPFLLILVLVLFVCTVHAQLQPGGGGGSFNPFYPQPPSSPNLRAQQTQNTKRLMKDLNLDELLREMNQFDVNGIFDKNDHKNGGKFGWIVESTLIDLLQKNQVGSLFNSPSSRGGDVPTVDWYRKLQTRLWQLSKQYGSKVPILFGIDSIHGASYVFNATLFPQQIGTAATFNTSHAYYLGLVSGRETRYAGIPWVFSPVLGIATQPSWARVFETFGEDPHLTAIMGISVIEGYQQRPPETMFPKKAGGTKANHTVAACAKHFVGYPDARTGRDRTPVQVPYNELLQYYVPSFDAAINDPRANVLSIMENYIELNGKPVVASSLLLNFFLRSEDQLNFQGMLVTDYNEIMNLHDFHKYSESYDSAVYDSLNATSIDMAMISGPNDGFPMISDKLRDLLNKGEMDEKRIRDSIARVLDLKDRLGLLGDDATSPVPDPQTAWSGPECHFGCDEHRQYALEAARDSITLLQNSQNTLPLDFSKYNNVAIIGQGCDSKGLMSGGWTVNWQGTSDDSQLPTGSTIKDEIERRFNNTVQNIYYNPGCNVTENSFCGDSYVQETLSSVQNADIVIMCIGERHYAEKPGDIFDLALPGGQEGLVKQIRQTVAPEKLVAILIEGRPRLLGEIPNLVPSILHAYLPGPHGGEAIVDVLVGKVNPSGKLPITYPKTYNGAPIQYWRKYSSNTGNATLGQNDYLDAIQWPFGHGLSYTTFAYSDLVVYLEGNNITVQVNVTNTGKVPGKEVVLVYSTQLFRRITPEVQMLRSFQKIHLEPGETKNVLLQFSYLELGYYDETNCKQFQSSPYIIMVANLSSTNTFASVREVPLQMQQCQGWGRYFLDHSAGAIIFPTNPPQPASGSEQDYFISSIVCFGAGIVITVIVVSFIRKRREKYNEDQNLLEPTGV